METFQDFIERATRDIFGPDLRGAASMFDELCPVYVPSRIIVPGSRRRMRALLAAHKQNLSEMGYGQAVVEECEILAVTDRAARARVLYRHADAAGPDGAALEAYYYCRRGSDRAWRVEILEMSNAPDPGLLRGMELA